MNRLKRSQILLRAFHSGLEQLKGELDMMSQEYSHRLSEEGVQRGFGLQELEKKCSQSLSQFNVAFDAFKMDVAKEWKAADSELECSFTARHVELTTMTGQQVNGHFAGLRTEVERKLREMQERVEQMRTESITERNTQLKAMEEERVAYKKAHEEHMRCLNMERDARMRETAEIRADILKTLADNRKVHLENHSQLESLIELERQSGQDLLETERTSRARELQDLKIMLARQFHDAHSAEKVAREAQFEELLRGVAASKTEVNQRFIQIDGIHTELRSSYEKLANSHAHLSSAHHGLSTSHTASCETQRGELSSFIELERNARASALAVMGDTHRAELAKLQNNIQSLEVFISEDRARTMQQQTQHAHLTSCADTKHNEFKQSIEERLAALETKFDVVAPQWSADFIGLKEEVSSTLATMQIKITEQQNSLKQSMHATQNQICSTTQAAVDGNTKIIMEESAQRCASTQELQVQIKAIMQAMATLSNLKEEVTCEYKSFVGNSLEQHYTTSVAPSQQLLDGVTEIVKSENEKSLQELQARIEEVRASLISERSLHLKWMEEERTAFKKAHDEHMRCVEVERDARLRQATELRTEFVKLITKEREDRIIDASVRRSEVDRAKQSIKAMSSGLDGGSTRVSSSLETSTLLLPSPGLKSPILSLPR